MIKPSLIGFCNRISFRSVAISKRIGAFERITLRFYGYFADVYVLKFYSHIRGTCDPFLF